MVGKLQKQMLYWRYFTLINFLKGKVNNPENLLLEQFSNSHKTKKLEVLDYQE